MILAVGKCSNVVYEISYWHKKITIRLLAVAAQTANKIRLKFLFFDFTVSRILPAEHIHSH